VRNEKLLTLFKQHGIKVRPRDFEKVARALETAAQTFSKAYKARHSWGKRKTWRPHPTSWPIGYLQTRRRQLELICKESDTILVSLKELDEEFWEPLAVECFLKDLRKLNSLASAQLKKMQRMGRPRDLARQRWVDDVAAIYEKAFNKKAAISGSNSGNSQKRGPFFELLILSAPEQVNLDAKAIRRILKRRASS